MSSSWSSFLNYPAHRISFGPEIKAILMSLLASPILARPRPAHPVRGTQGVHSSSRNCRLYSSTAFYMCVYSTGCPKIIVPCLCGYCGGAVDSIISVLIQLHRSSFNLEFEIFFESIWHLVADLWPRKDKISGYFKNGTSIVLQQCQNNVSFQRMKSY